MEELGKISKPSNLSKIFFQSLNCQGTWDRSSVPFSHHKDQYLFQVLLIVWLSAPATVMVIRNKSSMRELFHFTCDLE